MLKHRLLMSALLIPATIGLFAWDHHIGRTAPILLVVVLVIAARCVWELVTLARTIGLQPNLCLTIIGVWAMILLGWGVNADIGSTTRWFERDDEFGAGIFLWAAITVLFLLNAVVRYPLREQMSVATSTDDAADPISTPEETGRELATLSFELFAVAYVGVLLAATLQLRWLHPPDYYWLGAMIVAAKMGDVGAYTFGRLIGGPKMVPRLSPGKTWAGGVGHLMTAGLSAVAWLCWLGPMIFQVPFARWSLPQAAIFGIVVGFAGLIGDLAESLIKRDVGVKDAPALLPGFGGLLDLMDSILLAGPVAYAMWHLLR